MDGAGSLVCGAVRRRDLRRCGSAGVVTPGVIEVEFANGSRMRITGVVDPATLAAAISVLNGAGRR
jgi:hypothetical protein